jgi:superfamily II DNA or RNA helicase
MPVTLPVTLFENPEKVSQPIWNQLGIEPRKWQAEALPIALEAIAKRKPALVQAVMGAGKSIFILGLIAERLRQGDTCIVVTTSRKKLVQQLSSTFMQFLPPRTVGSYYGSKKQPARPVVVACDASTERLASSLSDLGRKVDLWIADECHNSEADRIKNWCESTRPRARIGLTATPQRGNENEHLSLWKEEIYRYDAGQALRDGVVVGFDLVHWDGPEVDLDDAMTSMIQDWHHIGPGVVDAQNIEDAEVYAAVLNQVGIRTGIVHSALPSRDVDRRMEELRLGDLDAVVHVSLLKEGVDMPWLRWMGLRRQVHSKVYFAQHVGRVLRAHPGKDKAIVLDPGDLFSRHKLNLEAILEARVQENNGLRVIDGGRSGGSGGAPSADEVKQLMAVPLSDDASTLRKMLVQLQTEGKVEVTGGRWREHPVSEKQIDVIEKFVGRKKNQRLLKKHAQVNLLRRMYARRHRLSKGEASDFISILFQTVED